MEELIDPVKVTEEMKAGLAQMYANEGFRKYLANSIATANFNVLQCLKQNKPEEAKEYAARIDTLQRLLEKGKTVYSQAEKLRTKSLEELAKEKEHETI